MTNYNSLEYIFIPKGTKLIHYSTRDNDKRTYRWYYLFGQDFKSTIIGKKMYLYETKRDLYLRKDTFPFYRNRSTGHKELYDGTHGMGDTTHIFRLNKPNLPYKNSLTPEFATFEGLCNIDPLNIVKHGRCVEYEFVINNSNVKLLGTSRLIEREGLNIKRNMFVKQTSSIVYYLKLIYKKIRQFLQWLFLRNTSVYV